MSLFLNIVCILKNNLEVMFLIILLVLFMIIKKFFKIDLFFDFFSFLCLNSGRCGIEYMRIKKF